jgi:hypothetical protein
MPIVSTKHPLQLCRVIELWADEAGERDINVIACPLVQALVDGRIALADRKYGRRGETWLDAIENPTLVMAEEVLSALAEAAEVGPDSALERRNIMVKAMVRTWTGFSRDERGRVYSGAGCIGVEWFEGAYSHLDLPIRRAFCLIEDAVLSLEVTRDSVLRWADEEGYALPKFWGDEAEAIPAPANTNIQTDYLANPVAVKKNARGPRPEESARAAATLRAAVAADPSLRDRTLTEKELMKLSGAKSRTVARKARREVLGE